MRIMTTPNRKKFNQTDGRSCSTKVLNDDLSLLILTAQKNEVKDTLLKLKIEVSYDTNIKNIANLDVNRLKDIAEILGEDTNGILKDGLVFLILLEVYSRLGYKCYSCKSIVKKNFIDENIRKCISCKADMCPNCYDGSGRGFICDPCQVWSLEKFNLPLEFLKKSKRMAVAKEANINYTEDTVIDSTIVDSQDVSLPLGQNHPTNSTALDTNYRGASLLDDPSLVSDEESNKEENTILGDESNKAPPRNTKTRSFNNETHGPFRNGRP